MIETEKEWKKGIGSKRELESKKEGGSGTERDRKGNGVGERYRKGNGVVERGRGSGDGTAIPSEPNVMHLCVCVF